MRATTLSLIQSASRLRGFTLLELCVVLFIIALLAGAAMPAMNSAFTEQALRTDAREFSVLVKTAMITTAEQQRPYLIRLEGGKLDLEPAPGSSEPGVVPPEDVSQTGQLGNVLKFPDATKKNAWETEAAVTWTFEPAGLCPLPRVRLERGNAYIEMSFNALTGDVEDESTFLP